MDATCRDRVCEDGGVSMVRLDGIEVRRGASKILDVPRLIVGRGETLAVVGPNGAGKSTLLQVMACLVRPTRGEVSIAGRLVGRELSVLQARRRCAMVLQRPFLLNTTVFDNVAAGLRIRGIAHGEVAERVRAALEMFGIERLASRPAHALSGGESQRVSLARAFVLQPDVLFLDEPTSALDMPTRMALLAELGEVVRRTRVTTVFVTHDVIEIPFLAERTLVMRDGRIVADGPVRDVLDPQIRHALSGLTGSARWILSEEDGNVAAFPLTHATR